MAGPANSINESTTGLTGFTGTSFTGTPVTQYNVLTGSATSYAPNNVAPSATAGIPLVSNGNAAQPSFTTAVVAGGGTGDTSFTAYSVITGGTTSTGNLQNVSGLGTIGQVLTSAGSGALPVWANSELLSAWTDEAVSFAAVAGDGYFITAPSVVATLPATPSQGQTIEFVSAGAGSMGLTIQANTGQTIIIGAGSSTVAGTAINNADGDSVTLVYQLATTTWWSTSVIGTWSMA